MRLWPLLLPGLLCGCATAQPVAALLALEGASVMVFGRGVLDLGVSGLSGRDCSIVRLDRGQTYCAPNEPMLAEPYCTRSLGTPDCWADRALLPSPRAGLGDTPPPTAAQARYRAARWPKSITAD